MPKSRVRIADHFASLTDPRRRKVTYPLAAQRFARGEEPAAKGEALKRPGFTLGRFNARWIVHKIRRRASGNHSVAMGK